jgi:hypothetical protein
MAEDGSVTLTGYTFSDDLPIVKPIQDVKLFYDAWVGRIESDGSAWSYLTYYGGTSTESGNAATVDADGNAYVVGYTWSDDIPGVPDDAHQPGSAGLSDAFLLKLSDPAGPSIILSAFQCGGEYDWVTGKPMEFEIRAYDTPGESVSISASLPASAVIGAPSGTNPAVRTVTWSPVAAEAGDHTITISASDGTNTTECSFTVSVVHDSDGDGLPNLWETAGYTAQNGVFVDLPNLKGLFQTEGARPDRKDIFVEIDYMGSLGWDDDAGAVVDVGHDHRPSEQGLQWIVEAFAAQGIALHLFVDTEADHWESLGPAPSSYDWTQFDSWKAFFGRTEWRPAFHYCLFAHQLGESTDSGISRNETGATDLGASDFIVALGTRVNETGTVKQQVGTFMHELGHNMGLRHGGDRDENYNPAYISVMNYMFQMTGVLAPDGSPIFDYSRFALGSLDEMYLDENAGIPGGSSHPGYGTRCLKWRETVEIDGEMVERLRDLASVGTVPLDWNDDGQIESSLFCDLNEDGKPTSVNDRRYSALRGYHDWPNLVFLGGAVGARGATVALPQVTESEEITLEEEEEITPEPDPGNPPVAVATVAQSQYAPDRPGGALVLLDGTGSSDQDPDDTLSWFWYEMGVLLGTGETLSHVFPPGDHEVELVVEDGQFRSDPATVSFTVLTDGMAPVIEEVRAKPMKLAPPNDRMREVVITVTASDDQDPAPVSRITGVTCDENCEGDVEQIGPLTVMLRKTRDDQGDGRVYTVHVECRDAAGNASVGKVDIRVPYDVDGTKSTTTQDPTQKAGSEGKPTGSTTADDGKSTQADSEADPTLKGSTGTVTDGKNEKAAPESVAAGSSDLPAKEDGGDKDSGDDAEKDEKSSDTPVKVPTDGDGIEKKESGEQAGKTEGGTKPAGKEEGSPPGEDTSPPKLEK